MGRLVLRELYILNSNPGRDYNPERDHVDIIDENDITVNIIIDDNDIIVVIITPAKTREVPVRTQNQHMSPASTQDRIGRHTSPRQLALNCRQNEPRAVPAGRPGT